MKAKLKLLMLPALLCGWAVLLVVTIAKGFYDSEHAFNRLGVDTLVKTPDGRSGWVVSHVPFDLRVTVNVPASEDKQRWFATHQPWNDPASQREWTTWWRWEVSPIAHHVE